MARFIFKRGEINYTDEEMEAIMIFVRRVAGILNKLSEKDARVISFAIDPTLDKYVLGGWDKQGVIQEALETMVANAYPNGVDDNLYDVVDSIEYGTL